jgi:NAD(P)-dependent dehydrogenase (short-subunit alcohol dehydrogenase family)
MKSSYEGKSVWITGGGSGLGKAMALRYSQLGARVAVSGRRADSKRQIGCVQAMLLKMCKV